IKKDLPEHFQIVAGPEFSSILTGLKLKPEESFIISRFEGTRYITIDMLSALTGFPEEQIRRFVYFLEKIGAVQFQVTQAPKPKPAPSSNPELQKPLPKDSSGSGTWLNEMTVRMEVLKSDKKVEMESHRHQAEEFFVIAEKKFNEGDYWKVT